jgi:uncharacterized membrane protein
MLGKHTLSPKEKTYLKITFNTIDSPGPFRKIVTISTNIPGQEETKVAIEGTVRETPAAKIQVTPRRVSLGTIQAGSVRKQEFTVTNFGALPLTVIKIYSRGSGNIYFDGAEQGNIVIEPGTTRKIELAIKADREPGHYQEFILIESNAKNSSKRGYMIIVQYDSS